ncbi:MAG: hypothetical protein NTX16_12195 [Actinobacteria bacterium]|nr:hypothetical protein [Actinomycetota bacterium]
MRLFGNTAAVIVLTLFTGLAVFTTIQPGDRLFGTSDASAQTVSAQGVDTIPATTGESQSAEDSYGDDSEAYSDPYDSGGSAEEYGRDQGSSSAGEDASGTTQTCPATGCSASSCHATE